MMIVSRGSLGQRSEIPDGTRLRVRLDQRISSVTADEGQPVNLSVTETVKVGNKVLIEAGARVTGTVTKGDSGADFSIDRVRCVGGEWIPIRYEQNRRSAVSAGVIAAGAAVLFWPATPSFLSGKSADTILNRGLTFGVFTEA